MYTLLYISEMNVRCTSLFKRESRTVRALFSIFHFVMVASVNTQKPQSDLHLRSM